MTRTNQALLSAAAAVTGIAVVSKVTGWAARLFVAFGLVFLTAAAATVSHGLKQPDVSRN